MIDRRCDDTDALHCSKTFLAALCALGGAAFATDFAPSSDLVKALTPDGVLVQAGRASDTTTLTLGLQWDWSRMWQIGERGRLSGYSEVSIGHWNADDDGGSAVVTQIGFTPTLRYWHGGVMTGWFYEAGIGVNLLTPLYRTREKRFSTAFNFGDHLAIGYRLAARAAGSGRCACSTSRTPASTTRTRARTSSNCGWLFRSGQVTGRSSRCGA